VRGKMLKEQIDRKRNKRKGGVRGKEGGRREKREIKRTGDAEQKGGKCGRLRER